MPSLSEFLSTWSLDPVALVVILANLVAYGTLIFLAHKRGNRWPVSSTIAFALLGLGAFAFINFGFFGTYRFDLRWAFTTRIALLLYGVPLLMSLGRPLDLARAARSSAGQLRLDRLLNSWPVRMISNAIFAPLFALAFFMLFITPVAATLRHSHTAQNLITVLAFLLGQLMLLPMMERRQHRSEIFMVAEFMLAFMELMLDAIPGVVLSISNTVMDGASRAISNAPAWLPTALNDQHFSGNLLWMIAEGADIPILVMLFIRWSHSDRHAAKTIDDLTDEQYEEMVRNHLKGPRP